MIAEISVKLLPMIKQPNPITEIPKKNKIKKNFNQIEEVPINPKFTKMVENPKSGIQIPLKFRENGTIRTHQNKVSGENNPKTNSSKLQVRSF